MKTSVLYWNRMAGWAGAAILLLPGTAFGNPITYSLLLVPHPARFILANVIIGILEGLVIGILNQIEKISCCLMMMVANLCSALLWQRIVEYGEPAASIVLPNDSWGGSLSHWTGYFLAAVILEAPFCGWLVRHEFPWLWQTVKSTLLAQAVSYGAILIWLTLVK